MKTLNLVAQYSFLEKVKKKGFFITTFVIILFLAALVFLPDLYNKMTSDEKGKVYVINQIEGLPLTSNELEKGVSKDYNWIMSDEGKEKELKDAINNKEDILLIKISQQTGFSPIIEVTSNNMSSWPFIEIFINTIQSIHTMQSITEMKLTQEQAVQLMTPVDVKINEVNQKENRQESYFPIYVALFLLYLLIMNFGATVGTSIAVEKGSRIKEVLITKVNPIYLLSGKMFGIGLAGLLQFGTIVLSLYIMIQIKSDDAAELFGMSFGLSVLSGSTLIYILLFFILGYILYSALYAAIGALVSRAEEINQATIPVSLLMMAGFLIAYFSGMVNPDSQMVQILSYVPFFTPFIMITRIVLTNLTALEILLPTVTMVVFIILTCLVAAKIYKAGVLIYGKKVNMRMLFKSMKQM